jgi:C-terminal processing protease CtpA/Prc
MVCLLGDASDFITGRTTGRVASPAVASRGAGRYNTRMRRLLPILFVATTVFAQPKLANPGFEEGEPGAVPTGWYVPRVLSDAGFGAKLVEQGCRTGRCAVITPAENPQAGMMGNLMQSLPATAYRLRRIRLRAAIRVEGAQTRAQMWLRLDRADHTSSFLENMGRNPVTSVEWKTYDIETDVPEETASIALGVMMFGPGKAWVDDVSLEAINEIRKDAVEPPRTLEARGLANLTAFARLYGYVRFFHPSDQAARIDWDTFAIEGARAIESAESDAQLADRLRKLFQPVAPTVQIYPTANPATPAALPQGPEIVRYHHTGVGLTTTVAQYTPYRSPRERTPAGKEALPKPFTAEIIPGLSAAVPLALFADAEGTLPHLPSPAASQYERTTEDRATRLAGVIIAWNVFEHFYPYFDVVKTDWAAELPKALRTAATDRGPAEFTKTLARLVAALKDGHGRVGSPVEGSYALPPVTFDWIENQFLVTRVQKNRVEGVAPGDRVLKIDGRPIDEAAAEERALVSGATEQWIRYRTAGELSRCKADRRSMTIEIEPYAARGTTKSVSLPCGPPKFKDPETYTEPRPDKISELEPGIIYVDLDRVTEPDWVAVVPRLEKAKGIIFDMRGYPAQPGIQALAHLTDNAIRSARWNIPQPTMPDRLEFPFVESGWPVPPEKPYFSARRVFLTDGRAISYAETVMGIVEAFKLGDIVGGPTAGTNGNVNPFKLPGGHTISWTGMKVLKHDGSQHHGIGILPTVPASRTRQGAAENKDEVLLRGLEVVKSKK